MAKGGSANYLLNTVNPIRLGQAEEELQRQAVPEEKEKEDLQTKAGPGGAKLISQETEVGIRALGGGGQPLPERYEFNWNYAWDTTQSRTNLCRWSRCSTCSSVNASAFTVVA